MSTPHQKSLESNAVFEKLCNPNAHVVSVLIYSYLYACLKTLKLLTLAEWLWPFVCCELVYIGGACQNSGNCCKNLMLFDRKMPLNTQALFDKYKTKNPNFERFIPKRNKATIHSFSCNCLTPDNYCNDYTNRPFVCRHYPHSYYMQHEKLLPDCGYKVYQKRNLPKLNLKSIRDKIETLCINVK